MRLRFFLLVTALLALPYAAHAQRGVYVNFEAEHVGSSAGASDQWVYGPQFGFQSVIGHAGPLYLGWNLQGSILSHGDAKLNSGMAGLYLTANTHVIPFRPYIEALAGVGGYNYGQKQSITNSFQYTVNGGLFSTILPHVDWRVIEVGGGELTSHNNNLFHLSTGVMVRF